jgi:hypothetical protein
MVPEVCAATSASRSASSASPNAACSCRAAGGRVCRVDVLASRDRHAHRGPPRRRRDRAARRGRVAPRRARRAAAAEPHPNATLSRSRELPDPGLVAASTVRSLPPAKRAAPTSGPGGLGAGAPDVPLGSRQATTPTPEGANARRGGTARRAGGRRPVRPTPGRSGVPVAFVIRPTVSGDGLDDARVPRPAGRGCPVISGTIPDRGRGRSAIGLPGAEAARREGLPEV